MGRMSKKEPSRAGESLLPAPTQQVGLKSAVCLDPDHTQLPQSGQCARPPRVSARCPLSAAPRGWGWCPEVAASGVLVAPYTLYKLSPVLLGAGAGALRSLPLGSWWLPTRFTISPQRSSSERGTCFLLDSAPSRTLTPRVRE